MCVIIYCPKEAEIISKQELSDAWDYNPDGAGFAVQQNGKVHYKRGYMNKEEFINTVMKYIGKYNTVLHFRISTSTKVNKLQCHPYERNDIESLSGSTNDSVICMNGIVSCEYTDRKRYNDTMNYILDHKETFQNMNQHIMDMIGKVTGSKWFIMKPNSIFKTDNFTEYEGRWYSNENHLIYNYSYPKICYSKNKKNYNYLDYDYYDEFGYGGYDFFEEQYEEREKMKQKLINDFFSKSMIKKLKQNEQLWNDIEFFIEVYCLSEESQCGYCQECFEQLKSKKEIRNKMEEEFGFNY